MRGSRAVGAAAVTLLGAFAIVGCKTAVPPELAGATPDTVDGLVAAIAADAQRSDSETDSKVRERLAADAGRDADACLARAPTAAACLYYGAVARGLEARAHPLYAAELLKTMLDSLTQAEAADPRYDHAGPARVRALVLTKAPGWPLGPGDPEAGLAAARSAVQIEPTYPPNVLALAEALSKTGDADGSRLIYAQARDVAAALAPSADRDDWMRQADQGLRQ